MIRQRIPNDNSCLFNAVDYLTEGGTFRDGAAGLRGICVAILKENPDTYDSTRLEMVNISFHFHYFDEYSITIFRRIGSVRIL